MSLSPSPSISPRERRARPALSQNHFTGIAPDAEFEALAPHRPQLYAHQPLDYHG
jgi:hypothetical protein